MRVGSTPAYSQTFKNMSNPNFSYCVECDRTAERSCDTCGADLCKNCYKPFGLCVPCLEGMETEDEYDEYYRDKSEEV